MSNSTDLRCFCGHYHAGTCHCGCTVYERDDGTDGVDDDSCLGPNRLSEVST